MPSRCVIAPGQFMAEPTQESGDSGVAHAPLAAGGVSPRVPTPDNSTGPAQASPRSPSAFGAPSHASRPLRTGVVILAAGASTRMGTSKQLLEIEGRPLLLRTVDAALRSAVWPVVVVLGDRIEAIRPVLARLPVLVTENPAWTEGMASSIRAGVTTLQQFSRQIDAALIALCDQPAFSADTIDRLITAQRTTGRSIVAARYAGRHGAPAIFRREHFPTLTHLTGEEGARALLNGAAAEVAVVDLPELALDLDTPADVEAFRRSRNGAEPTG